MNASVPSDFREVTSEEFHETMSVENWIRDWWANGAWYLRHPDRLKLGFFDDEKHRFFLKPKP